MTKETSTRKYDKQSLLYKLLPLILTIVVILLDQISKYLVVKYIPVYHVGASFGGDLLRFVYVQNTAAAFSIGNSLSSQIRIILLKIIPVIAIVLAMIIYFKSSSFNQLQRWSFCGIIGGGIGNLIDRIFRSTGVVDFIDVKFFGIFGWERWPTFNIADSAIVVCAILLIISVIHTSAKAKNEK